MAVVQLQLLNPQWREFEMFKNEQVTAKGANVG